MIQDKKNPPSKWSFKKTPLSALPVLNSILISLLNLCSSIIFCCKISLRNYGYFWYMIVGLFPSPRTADTFPVVASLPARQLFPGHFRRISEKSARHRTTVYTKWIYCLSFIHFSQGVSELREIDFDSFQNNAHSKRWSVLNVATQTSFRTRIFVKCAVRSFQVLQWFRTEEKPSLKILK